MVKGMWHVVIVVLVCSAGAVMASDVPGTPDRVLGPPGVAESESGAPASAEPRSTADLLRNLTPAERRNARLSLEGAATPGEGERQQARQVEALWAEGRHDEAIALLAQLEAGGARLAAGISWRQPLVSGCKSPMTDARIGDPRVAAQDVALDFDQATGNLFAVVAWGGSDPGWSVNISTDNGINWEETYFWYPGAYVDAVVVDQYLYVAYGYGAWARMRRFFVADGAEDGAYLYHDVANVSPNTILDVSVGANADYTNDRVYCYFIESNNALRYFWADATTGTTWYDASPTVSDAASSMDFHWSGGTNYLTWITYWGTDGTGHVLGRSRESSWSPPHTLSGVPSDSRVRVSAYLDHVFVSYQYDYGSGRLSADYDVTHNEGASWEFGHAYLPDPGEPGCHGIDITARGGWGSVAVWNVEDSFDSVYVASREDYGSGGWNDPIGFNQFDAYSGGPSFIQYLGSLEAVGMVYLAGGSGATAIPYFDLMGLLPFGDGFETHDTSGWSATVP